MEIETETVVATQPGRYRYLPLSDSEVTWFAEVDIADEFGPGLHQGRITGYRDQNGTGYFRNANVVVITDDELAALNV